MKNAKEFIQENLLTKSGKLNSQRLNLSWFERSGNSEWYPLVHTDQTRSIKDCARDILYGPRYCGTCGTQVLNWGNRDPRKVEEVYCSKKCGNNSPKKLEATSKMASDPEMWARRRETFIERFGSANPMSNPDIQRRSQETLKERYGCLSANPDIRAKVRATNLERYGVEHALHCDKAKRNLIRFQEEVRDTREFKLLKRKELLLSKGVDPDSFSDDDIIQLPLNHRLSGDYLVSFLNRFEGVSLHDPSLGNDMQRRWIHFVERGAIVPSLKISTQHGEMIRRVEAFNNDFTVNDRTVISPYELDMYFPEHKFAIEINGTFWHSDYKLEKDYHSNKERLCREAGIKLFQLYEWQNMDIAESYVRSILGASDRIYARNTVVRELTAREYNDFCEANHMHGTAAAGAKLGLVCKSDPSVIFQVMSFGKPRFTDHDWELIRLCSAMGKNVLGGAEKLFKHFLRTRAPESIISYHSRDFGKSGVYERLGFNLERQTPPSYNWVGSTVLSRYQTQKSRLGQLLGEAYRPDETEDQNLRRCGFLKVWNSGNDVYIWRPS